MSIWALCASSVSWIRIGSAWELISWSRPLPFGYWTTATFVIFLLEMVSCTCTGPQRVCATVPVTVLEVAADLGAAAALLPGAAALLLGAAALEGRLPVTAPPGT